MTIINKNTPPVVEDIEKFLKNITFNLPEGFMDFFKTTNGADIDTGRNYLVLWPLTEMLKLNEEYNVAIYAPEFFVFGSDGGDIAYAIQKNTGNIFEIPFIGMSKKQAVFKYNTFTEFLENL